MYLLIYYFNVFFTFNVLFECIYITFTFNLLFECISNVYILCLMYSYVLYTTQKKQ